MVKLILNDKELVLSDRKDRIIRKLKEYGCKAISESTKGTVLFVDSIQIIIQISKKYKSYQLCVWENTELKDLRVIFDDRDIDLKGSIGLCRMSMPVDADALENTVVTPLDGDGNRCNIVVNRDYSIVAIRVKRNYKQ